MSNISMTDAELLKFAIENGMLDTALVQEKIEMQKRKELLDKHPYAIWKSTDGKWKTYLPDESKNNGRRMLKRNSIEEIEAAVVQYWKEATEVHTLESVFYEWIKEKLGYGEIEKATYDRYETDFLRFFQKKERDLNLKYITEEYLEQFIKKTIHEKQLTSKAYAGLRTLIIGIFKYAKKKGYTDISISVFFGDLNLSKKIFRKKVRCAEKEVFTENEIKKIVAYINSRENRIRELGILLAIYTGVRPGELSALKPSDINLKEKLLHIQRSEVKYKDENGKCIIGVREFPKSDAGDRYLILTDKALSVIKDVLVMNAFGEYLFEDEKTKRRISENGFNHKLSRLCNAVKIPTRTMHRLRKTYGTTLINSKVDDSIIQEQMGHADIKTTRQYYYYSNQEVKEKRDQLNRACIC